ncbi:hypothetical protein SS50377_25263 [Spironucleus salmonicida]|uniref:Uncharacterized protein n=1 Tax=Spironucleus salmonicida TaxID=348837 RepID=V6LDU1_9EUKA|nr:hypothetical protein SS50377_25263 [Spironucleus salmonicida]|eukprot:EST41856.1 Hypothetical protein SS50377_18690 [Spironucleus salmonicida]
MGCGSPPFIVDNALQQEPNQQSTIQYKLQAIIPLQTQAQPLSRSNTETTFKASTALRDYKKMNYEIQKLYDQLDPEHIFVIEETIFQSFMQSVFHFVSTETLLQFFQFLSFPIAPKVVGDIISIIIKNPFQKPSLQFKQKEVLPPKKEVKIHIKNEIFDELQINQIVQSIKLFTYLAENGFQPNYQIFNQYIDDNLLSEGIDLDEFPEIFNYFTDQKQIHNIILVDELEGSIEEVVGMTDWQQSTEEETES